MAKKRTKKYFTEAQVFRVFIRKIPGIIAGTSKRHTAAERRIYNSFWSAYLLQLFIEIHHAYEVKSALGMDDNGDFWNDLDPTTKAYKRRGVKDMRGRLTGNQRRKLNNKNTIGLLSPSQYRRWRKTFAKVYKRELRRLTPKKGEQPVEVSTKDVKAKAASIAWADAKNRGAETLLSVLGSQQYPVMRVTDTLINSVRPGRINNKKYVKGDKNQVARLEKGTAYIGTKVPYAKYATRTIHPRRTPFSFKREFLPDDLGVFYDRALDKARDAVMKEIQDIVKENKHLK